MAENDLLVSIAATLLEMAELDAAHDDQLIFRPEWKPTPRTRSSIIPATERPQRKTSLSWLLSALKVVILSDDPNESSLPGLGAAPASQPTLASQPAPASQSSSAPAILLPAEGPEEWEEPDLDHDAVRTLLKDPENDKHLRKLLDHPFPRTLSHGRASLDGFRYYMVQDQFYLKICSDLKEFVGKAIGDPSFRSSGEGFRRHTAILNSILGIPKEVVKATRISKKVTRSKKTYEDAVRKNPSKLAYYIVLLPCVLSYYQIADRLMFSSSTVTNVVYYRAWIEENFDPSSAFKYTEFIKENIRKSKGGAKQWNNFFRKACKLEVNIFNMGSQAVVPYQIIRNGIYFIRSSEGLVFENSDGFPVIGGYNQTGKDIQRWTVIAEKKGYTFQNVETDHYIGIHAKSGKKGSRHLRAMDKPYYWWINPVEGLRSKLEGHLAYQILESRNLQYAWTFGFYYESCIIVSNNTEDATQEWSFVPDFVLSP